MADNRKKSKLSSKDTFKISLIVSAIYFICILVNGLISKPTGDEGVNYWFLRGVIGTLMIFFAVYFIIFKGEKRKEEEKKMEFIAERHLSQTEFTEVYFVAKGYGSCMEMMKEILKKEGCRFYAKLTDDQNIYIVVKDKNNETVYKSEIANYSYFNFHFTFEE